MGRLFLRFFVGGLAGILVWIICEPAAPKTISDSVAWDRWSQTFVLLMGGAIGLAVGGLDGFFRGGKIHTLRGAGLGLVFGAICCPLGYGIGGRIADMVFGPTVFGTGNIVSAILARTTAFVFIGAFLGAGIGLSSLNPKKALQGLIGGALGGALAGVVFDPLGNVLGQAILSARGQSEGEVGVAGRAVMAIVLGAAIGLFIGLVERWARSAWLRHSVGRNEGREWSIDKDRIFIGRGEGMDVPLFGDANIAPLHAYIQRHGPDYVLVDGGAPIGTFVNGQRVQQVALMHGSHIQIGGYVLQFLMKNQSAPAPVYDAVGRGSGYPMGGPAGGYAPSIPAQPAPNPAPYAPTGMGGFGAPAPQPTQAYPPMGGAPTIAFGSPNLPSSFSIVAIDGPMLGQRFPVGGPIELGREGSGVRMAQDLNASRRHAAISPGIGGVAVQDLGSTNGTFVNGQRVSQSNAGPGDLIKVGSTTFRVEAT